MNYIGKISLLKYLDKFHQIIIDNLHLLNHIDQPLIELKWPINKTPCQ